MIEISNYPYTINENREKVRVEIKDQFSLLVAELNLAKDNYKTLNEYFVKNFTHAEELFDLEEFLRSQGKKGANLYYHGREHAVYQITYDAIVVTRAILSRKDYFSNYLTLEGAIANVIASMYHDTGYVNADKIQNYASRTPFHVECSKRTFLERWI